MKRFFQSTVKRLIALSLSFLFLSTSGIILSLADAQASSHNLCKEIFVKELKQSYLLDQTPSIPSDELVSYLSRQIDRVLEFAYIRNLAQKKGIRVWLFGGSAASYLHYVRWDLARIQGRASLQPERFDYDFTNIFRSTQDIDLVVDATPKEAREFELALAQRFPHFLGEKSNHWEVRTLRQAIESPGLPNYKEALLNDPDFQNQNTDSQSIGMIEITPPHAREALVRDLKSWNQFPGLFLTDAVSGSIHLIRSKAHFETSRAKLGQNPEILSVLRALVKAFQFDLKFSTDDFKQMKEIIDHFDFDQIPDPIARKRVMETAKKLVFHAVNLENAFDQLDQLGLRTKLTQLGSIAAESTLPWWLNREPLRSFPLGQGSGQTARELGISIVSHETKDFLAMESITRAPSGEPNAFISRSDAIGEAAMYGDGFYTTIGKKSSRGTGMTIRFRVHPDARIGSDFDISTQAEEMVVFKNKKALEILPESLDFNLDDLLQLAETDSAWKIDKPDQGLWERHFKRLSAAKFSHELDQLLTSPSNLDFEKGLKILQALMHIRVIPLISEEIRKSVIKTSFKILGNIDPGMREEKVIQLIKENSFFKDQDDLLDLLIHARKNKAVRSALMEIYGDETTKAIRPILHEIIHDPELSSEVASSLIKTMEEIFKNQLRGGAFHLEKELFEIQKLTEQNRIGTPLIDGILVAYAHEESRLGHEFWHYLASTDSTRREAVIPFLSNPRISSLETIQALQEIIEFSQAHQSSMDLHSAAMKWIQSSSVSPSLKAHFLMSHFGYPEFQQFRWAIPQDQIKLVMSHCLETRQLGALKRLAIQDGIDLGKRESFIFQPRFFPKEGKRVTLGTSNQSLSFLAQGISHLAEHQVILNRYFEIQATPVTQLQWALVMHENPSFFTEEGQLVRIKNIPILMNPNHPVERVSWVDIQKFISKLNLMDSDYDYRLPTEAEWEYSSRDARISSVIRNPDEVAWYYANSEMKTHEVASQHPLPSGLYDSYGNVWEWVQDGFSRQLPTELSIQSRWGFTLDRVIRGGAYYSGRRFTDSPDYTLRDRKHSKTRDQAVGFRLVRVPKAMKTNQGSSLKDLFHQLLNQLNAVR